MNFSAFLSTALSKVFRMADYGYGDYGNYGDYGYASEAAGGVALVLMILMYVFCFAISIVLIIAMWKIFTKAREAGWWSLIPYANSYMLFKIVYGNGWKFLLLLVPGLNCVLPFFLMYRHAQVFGKGGGFAAGLIFLPYIFMPMLAFGNARYRRPMKNVFM